MRFGWRLQKTILKFGVNDTSNRVDLPKVEGADLAHPNSSTHHGWNKAHSDYNNTMKIKVEQLEIRANANNWNPEKTQSEIQNLQSNTKNKLQRGDMRCG